MRHIGIAVGLVAASLGLLLVVACGGPAPTPTPTPTPELSEQEAIQLVREYLITRRYSIGDEQTISCSALYTYWTPTWVGHWDAEDKVWEVMLLLPEDKKSSDAKPELFFYVVSDTTKNVASLQSEC